MSHSFIAFKDRIRSVRDNDARQAAVDNFMNNVKSREYPIFEDDETAVLLYQGAVTHVSAIGDMSDWISEIPFTRQKVHGWSTWLKAAGMQSRSPIH